MSRFDRLLSAVRAIHLAAYWHPDRPVENMNALFQELDDAAGMSAVLRAQALGDRFPSDALLAVITAERDALITERTQLREELAQVQANAKSELDKLIHERNVLRALVGPDASYSLVAERDALIDERNNLRRELAEARGTLN